MYTIVRRGQLSRLDPCEMVPSLPTDLSIDPVRLLSDFPRLSHDEPVVLIACEKFILDRLAVVRIAAYSPSLIAVPMAKPVEFEGTRFAH